jgi:hypothetical protein
MANCDACGDAGAKYRIKNPQTGGFHPERFCKRCRTRMVAALRKAGGRMELNALMNGITGGIAPVETNPEKPDSKAQFHRHRQAPPECFYAMSYRTVPLEHTTYPKTGPYMVPGALAITSRIKQPCAKKYGERGVRVRYRAWATQSILTPKEFGLRPTRAEMALENPTMLYTITDYNVKKYGRPFWAMKSWASKNVAPYPKVKHLFKKVGKGALKVTEKAAKAAAPHVKKGAKAGAKATVHVAKKGAHLAGRLAEAGVEAAESGAKATKAAASKMEAEGNPADYTIVSEGPDVIGFDKKPVYDITVKMGKGVKIKDIVVNVANYAYEKGWGGTPTVTEGGKGHVKFTFKEQYKPSGGTTYEDYKEAVEGEGWAIGDYKDMLSKARSDEEKEVLGHILKEEQEHLNELQSLMIKEGLMPVAGHNPVQMHLPIEQAIYVPSTKDGNTPIPKAELDARVQEAKAFLSDLFGGYTSVESVGGYHSPTKGLVEEPVVKVTSFATKESYDANRAALQAWLSAKAKMWGQESIGYEVEGDLMYMNPDPNRHYTAKERRAIIQSTEFKEWMATRRAAGIKPAEQGAFHAFMTDVGKRSGHRKEKEWTGDPSRADRRAPPLDSPTMKKYYHGLGKNPDSGRPVKLDMAFNAFRDMFHFFKGRVSNKDINIALKKWPRHFGKANVEKAWKELKKDGFVVQKGKMWEWPMMLPEALEGTTHMNPGPDYSKLQPGDPELFEGAWMR